MVFRNEHSTEKSKNTIFDNLTLTDFITFEEMMHRLLRIPVIFFIAFTGLMIQSCDQTGPNGPIDQITFSRDTVIFDTVFTQMGSHTEVVKIRNNGPQAVSIDNVYLGTGSNSVYRINVNGWPGDANNSVSDIEIDANDSVYVFIEVTLDPNNSNAPLIHEDSLMIEMNGKTKKAELIAFGQDAHYFYPTDTLSNSGLPYSIIPCNEVWKNDKPYVIVGWAVVDSDCELKIEPGVRVHFFNNGALWVYKDGTLQVLGEREQPVTFQGTRLQYAFQDQAGQWDRILINEGSTNNIIRNAIIKNGYIGLQCDNLEAISGNPGTPNQVTLENVIIQNMSGLGIYTNNMNIRGYNTLVNNCGQYSAVFAYGGNIEFYHSTLVNYWSNSIRNYPTLFMNNFYVRPSDGATLSQPLNAKFYNSIIYGSTQNEIGWDQVNTTSLDFRFDHCLLRIDPDESTSDTNRFKEIIKNADPKFEDTFLQDFRLKVGSAAINKGKASYVTLHNNQLFFDLKGSNRLWTGAPDLGAYEY